MKIKTIETERLTLREVSLKDEEVFLKSKHCFAIVWKETGKVIGSIGLEKDSKRPDINCMELGYAMSEDFWGRGLMTEAASAVIEYGFKGLKLERISVYKICNGTIKDVDCFSMTKGEYKKIKNNRKTSYAYMLRCNDGSLYGGYTTDIEKRLETHNSGKGAKYTRGRLPVQLAYLEKFPMVSMGKKREAELKKLSKAQKEKLVKEFEKNK